MSLFQRNRDVTYFVLLKCNLHESHGQNLCREAFSFTCLSTLKNLLVFHKMVAEEEKATNEISPLKFSRPCWTGRITLLRLPICIFGISNWIFVNNNNRSTWKGFILFLQATLSTTVHLCGLTTVLVFLYGFFSNGNITESVPLPLQYVYTSQMVFPVFSACLFLAKSWNKQLQCIDVLTQHKYDITYCKQVFLNILVMGYVLFAFGSLFIRSQFFLFPAGSTDVAFEIMKNNDLKEKFKTVFNIYQIYVYFLYYMFPSFMLCICINIKTQFKEVYSLLNKAIEENTFYKDGFFEKFVEIFCKKAQRVSHLNDLFNLHIGGLLVTFLNCLLCSLYMTLLLLNCDVPVTPHLSLLIAESFNIIIFLVPMAVLHSEVRYIYRRQTKFGVR